MKLHDFIHATSRQAWTVRLVLYIAVIVTICIVLQTLNIFWL